MKQFNNSSSVQDLIKTSLDKVKMLMETNTIVGQEITLKDGTTLIPISKASVGFVSGGGEYNDLNAKRNSADFPMAGGTGGGFTVSPIGFFVVDNNKFKLIRADKSTAYMGLIKSGTEVLKKFMEKLNEKIWIKWYW